MSGQHPVITSCKALLNGALTNKVTICKHKIYQITSTDVMFLQCMRKVQPKNKGQIKFYYFMSKAAWL